MTDPKLVNELNRSLRNGPPSASDIAKGRILLEQKGRQLAAEKADLQRKLEAARSSLATNAAPPKKTPGGFIKSSKPAPAPAPVAATGGSKWDQYCQIKKTHPHAAGVFWDKYEVEIIAGQ